MKIKELISPFKSLKTFVFVTIVFSIILNFVYWQTSFKDPKIFVMAMFWSSTIWLTQWLGNVYVGTKIGDKYSWFEEPKKRMFFGILALILYSGFAFLLVQIIMHYIFLNGIPNNSINWLLQQLKFSIPMSLTISFLFNSIGFFQNWKKSELNAQKLETEMLRYKFESLQNQINPHFLFNSFNVLSELIDEDTIIAKQFVQKMSGLYRYVLESKEKELVMLSEELDFIKKYIFLLETRFEKKVIINLNIQNTEENHVVPMALQLLIENAVKHNVATATKVLTIDIFESKNHIIVKNNLQLKKNIETSTKTGLNNLKQQYTYFTNKEILIEEQEGHFIVRVPLLMKINNINLR